MKPLDGHLTTMHLQQEVGHLRERNISVIVLVVSEDISNHIGNLCVALIQKSDQYVNHLVLFEELVSVPIKLS